MQSGGRAALALLLTLGPALAAEQQLVIKSKGVPDPALTALVAEVGQPETVAIKAGQRPLDVIVGRCGNNFSYLALAEQQVPDLGLYAPSATDRTVTLPACVSPGEPGAVVAASGDNLTVLSQRYGVSFRPNLTDWADLPGIPQSNEAGILSGLNQRFDTLSVRRPSVTDLFDVTSFSPADLAAPEPAGRPSMFRDLISPASLPRNQTVTLDDLDTVPTGTVGNEDFLLLDPHGAQQAIDGGLSFQVNVMNQPLPRISPVPPPGETSVVTASTGPSDEDSDIILTSQGPDGPGTMLSVRDLIVASGPVLPNLTLSRTRIPNADETNYWLSTNAATAEVFAQRVEPGLPAFEPQSFTAEDFSKWRRAQTSFSGILNNGQIRFENGLDSEFAIAENGTYVLPDAVPVWQTIRLKPEVTAETFEAARNALAARDPAVAPVLTALRLIDAPQQFHNIGDEQCGPDDGMLPYDPAAVLQQIGWTEALRQERGRQPAKPVGLMVLDNGFPDLERAALDGLWPQELRSFVELPRLGTHPSLSVGLDLRPDFKVNAAGHSLETELPASYPEDPAVRPSGRWHGLAVSMAALGGVPFEPYRRVTKLPMRMAFVGLVDAGGLKATAVNVAMRMAAKAEMHVINASFSFPSANDSLREAIEAMSRNMVLVVAAGNDGKDLNDTNSYPPKYGGRSTEAGLATVITVGMSRYDGTIHPRSSRSKTYVDLLAPGCGIGSYAIDGEGESRRVVRTKWTGTSFAAPLTAFAAALLDSYGLDPKVIKAQLIHSADFTPAPDGERETSVASGVLNIERALAFPFYQYVLADGRRLIDTVDPINRPEPMLCGRAFPLSGLARLAIRDGKAYFVPQPANPQTGQLLDRESCTLKEGDTLAFEVTDYASGDSVPVSLADLTDFIGRAEAW